MNREATKTRRKNELLATSKTHQEALSKELNTSSDRLVEFGKNMAVISSVLYVGYTVLDRFLEAKLKTTKKESKPNKFETLNKMILPLLAMALQQGSVVLMKKARIMLVDYLEEKGKKNV
ncbi:MAG: hypothetical protein DRI71_09350 [Bacteroidetes bacterium]|nr:MAG: hypothetical protein DRI71_09350 [Bacteroidota bacterium]